MSRKYSKLSYSDKEKVLEIISKTKPNLRYITLYYVRDDRTVDLTDESVIVGNLSNISGNSMSFNKYGGNVAFDKIQNATFDGEKLVGTKVKVAFCDDDSSIRLYPADHIWINFATGYFDFPAETTIEDVIETLMSIPGCTEYGEEIQMIFNYYKHPDKEIAPSWYCKMWHTIAKYNAFDLMDEYSNLFTYYSDLYLDENETDFFKAAGIVDEFKFRLSNNYLTVRDSRNYFINNLTAKNQTYGLYKELPDVCKEVFIEEAKKERFDIANLGVASYEIPKILDYVNRNPNFFIDYLRKYPTQRSTSTILNLYLSDCDALIGDDLALKYENLFILRLNKKARSLNVTPNDFVTLVSNLDTKEGILNYLQKTK